MDEVPRIVLSTAGNCWPWNASATVLIHRICFIRNCIYHGMNYDLRSRRPSCLRFVIRREKRLMKNSNHSLWHGLLIIFGLMSIACIILMYLNYACPLLCCVQGWRIVGWILVLFVFCFVFFSPIMFFYIHDQYDMDVFISMVTHRAWFRDYQVPYSQRMLFMASIYDFVKFCITKA